MSRPLSTPHPYSANAAYPAVVERVFPEIRR